MGRHKTAPDNHKANNKAVSKANKVNRVVSPDRVGKIAKVAARPPINRLCAVDLRRLWPTYWLRSKDLGPLAKATEPARVRTLMVKLAARDNRLTDNRGAQASLQPDNRRGQGNKGNKLVSKRANRARKADRHLTPPDSAADHLLLSPIFCPRSKV